MRSPFRPAMQLVDWHTGEASTRARQARRYGMAACLSTRPYRSGELASPSGCIAVLEGERINPALAPRAFQFTRVTCFAAEGIPLPLEGDETAVQAMLRAQGCTGNLHGLPIERLCLAILALAFIEARQIVEASCCLRMVSPQLFFSNRECLLQKRFGFCILSAFVQIATDESLEPT